jgi:small subunit ribosomal protein S1
VAAAPANATRLSRIQAGEREGPGHAPAAFPEVALEPPLFLEDEKRMTSKPQESVAPPETAEASSPETAPAASEELGNAELEQLLDQYSETEITSGEIRPATVVNLTADGVVVDLGLKSEGLVPLAEFSDDKGEPTIQPGAQIEVLIEGHEPKEGYVPCSSEGAHRLKLLREVESAYREQRKLIGRVTGRVKGGLQVEINLPGAHPGRRPLDAFMPG